MDYRLYIARHYLFDWRRLSLITVISGISMLSVAVGVFALVVVLSVMNGFADVVRGLLVDVDPHIRIVSANSRGFAEGDSIRTRLIELDRVTHASAYLEGKAMLLGGGGIEANRIVLVRGVKPEDLSGVSVVVDRTVMGEFHTDRENGRPGIVISGRLGQELSLFPETEEDLLAGVEDMSANRVQLLSAPGIERLLFNVLGTPPVSTFEIRGWYDMETVPEAYDETNVYVGLEEAQRLFRMPGLVSGIELKLDDGDVAPVVKARVQEIMGDEFEVLTWYDLQKSLYDVMRLEKWGASLIVALIILIAAFNMVGSMTIVVMEKRHDIGVLKSMGVSKEDVLRIFLFQGLLIAVVGTLLGLITGLGLCALQAQYGLVPMIGSESFILDAYPVSVLWSDVAIIVSIAMSLCVLAAIYPARRAAAVEPAEAVQVLD